MPISSIVPSKRILRNFPEEITFPADLRSEMYLTIIFQWCLSSPHLMSSHKNKVLSNLNRHTIGISDKNLIKASEKHSSSQGLKAKRYVEVTLNIKGLGSRVIEEEQCNLSEESLSTCRVDKKAAQQTESGSNNVSCRSVLKGSSQGSCLTGSSVSAQGNHKKNIKTKADVEIPKGSLVSAPPFQL